ncbi:ABC transporter substrate-binding protein [Pontibaca methylaminivorans]|uniref:ABC transporter substrate-binding protein n=1 Tax=Pontibaca methylaminivorans TaxID=515897 RepID=UPI002FDAEE45
MTRLDRRLLFTSGAAAALLAAAGLAPERAPRSGGRLRIAVPRDDSLAAVESGAIFERLTEVAPDGSLRPELATAWKGSEDARRWQFTLRDGVHFHDGRPLTAADAVESLRSRPLPERVLRLEATGSNRILVELAAGNPDLPYWLADPGLVVTPEGGDGSAGIGTGPYRLQGRRTGRQFLGTRVAHHYKDGEAAWAESVEVIAIPDAGVRAEALRDGYVDIAALPRPEGLRGRGSFVYHPGEDRIALAARAGVGMPRVVGSRGALDDGRIALRWWLA